MEHSTILATLALFTLLAAMAVAGYQLWDAEKAKEIPARGNDSLKPN